MATHSMEFLPREGRRDLVGYSPRGCKGLGTTNTFTFLSPSIHPLLLDNFSTVFTRLHFRLRTFPSPQAPLYRLLRAVSAELTVVNRVRRWWSGCWRRDALLTSAPLAALASRGMERAVGNWPELLGIQQAATGMCTITVPLAYPFIS